MHIASKLSVGAEFSVAVYKKDGTPVQSTPFFKNLVTNAGLARMVDNSWGGVIVIGRGSTQPTVNDVKLGAFAARTNTVAAGTVSGSGIDTGSSPHWWASQVYRFPIGSVVGNVTELGLSWDNKDNPDVWNRALIRDSLGNPTTLSILADEYLDVTIKIKVYVPAETLGKFNVVDRDGLLVSTHNYRLVPVLRVATTSPDPGAYYTTGRVTLGSGTRALNINSADMVDDLLTPVNGTSNTSANPTGVFQGSGAHTSKINTVTCTRQITSSEGNGGVHRSFGVLLTGLVCITDTTYSGVGFKVQVDPPIPKTPAYSLTYSWTLTLSRHAEDT